MKQLIFKIKYGYGVMDYVLVKNTADVEKAIFAKVEKVLLNVGGKSISGQEIKSIEPDIHSYTGWYRSFEPSTGDDFAQIERDVPKEAYQVLELCQQRVQKFLNEGTPERIGKEVLDTKKLLRLGSVDN